MFDEIGSEFWLDPGEFFDLPETSSKQILSKFGFGEIEAALMSSGRTACLLLLQSICPKNRIVLLPEYTCETVITPFLNAGFEVHCYEIEHDLNIDPEKWWEKYESLDPGIVLLHSYFGFDTIDSIRKDYDKIKSRETVIIEDITHSLFSRFMCDNKPDYYLASLRKWLGIPDGGFAVSCSRWNSLASPIKPDDEFVNTRQEALKLKNRFVKEQAPDQKERFLTLLAEAEEFLDRVSTPYRMSLISMKILGQTNWNSAITKRKENYRFLEKELAAFPTLLRPIFSNLPEDVCPLFMPVWIHGDRRVLREYLIANRIYPPIHWPLPEYFRSGDVTRINEIYDHCLSIPCDQRYTIGDMERIVTTIHDHQQALCR